MHSDTTPVRRFPSCLHGCACTRAYACVYRAQLTFLKHAIGETTRRLREEFTPLGGGEEFRRRRYYARLERIEQRLLNRTPSRKGRGEGGEGGCSVRKR